MHDNIFLSKIISMGIYNFTRNINAVKFLIDNGIDFKNMHMITANTLENAKLIYTTRYKCKEPICLGVVENDQFSIVGDKHTFTVPLVI